VIDGIVPGIDTATGQVPFQRNSAGHVPCSHRQRPVDARRQGKQLHPRRGPRPGPRPARELFAWQHDPEPLGNDACTFFDNDSNGASALPPASRAITVQLNQTTRTATLMAADSQPEGLLAASQGNAQTTGDGTLSAAWGSPPASPRSTPAARSSSTRDSRQASTATAPTSCPSTPRNSGGHMTTEVILTGTGLPGATPGRAGAGTLMRTGQVAVQFDAGRATALRLAEAGTHPAQLDALFLTHVHSDHVQDVPDLTMTRWLHQKFETTGPLPIVAPDGPTARSCAGCSARSRTTSPPGWRTPNRRRPGST
jgi:Metallo-beta-lactamase superfamily